jgi:hypothetical protein
MGRVFNLILLAAMIVGAVATYNMKHKAELAADRVATLQSDVAKEKQRITMLKAEWSLLTQPARLQATIEKYADHFQLEPFSPEQIASIDEIPLKPVGIDDKAAEKLARIAAAAPGELR